MKMKNINIRIFLFAIVFVMAGWLPVSAQQGKSSVSTEFEIVDETGNAIPFAVVSSAKKRNFYTTNESGRIVLSVPSDDMLKISAAGYRTETVTARTGKVTLHKELAFNGESSKLYTLFGETTERRTVGAWSKVDGRDLETTPTMYCYNALGGRLNGLFTSDNTLVPGFSTSDNWARANQGNMLIFVDGVERGLLDYVDIETVESVQLLKDASLKSLYGGINCSGILMIKTRRGKAYENSARVNVQTGIQQPLRLPEYLNAYDYATMYNKAAERDGFQPQYINVDKYKTQEDPILYPDVDYYKMFLNNQMNITRINMQYSGGNQNTRFFTHLGFKNNGGLEKFTQYPNNDRVFTIRGNVDNVIKKFITFTAGFNAALQNKTWYNNDPGTFMNMLSNTRPNEFPILIPGKNVGKPERENVLGGTMVNQNNPYGALVHSGFADREFSYIQSDFSLNFDLDQWVQGFSVRPMLTFDMYNFFTSTQGETYVVWEPYSQNDPDKPIGYSSWGQETKATSQSRSGATTQRNYAFNVTGAYNRVFGKHDINALMMFFWQRKEFNSLAQDLKRLNLGGTINYMYNTVI
jgi:hypothetical protein